MLCASLVLADGTKGNKGNGNGGQNQNQSNGQGQSDNNGQNQSEKKHQSNNSNKKGADSNGPDKIKMGDSGFDKNGIGRMDEKRFSGDKNSKERFQQHGKEWWYWTHSGHWCYWRGGQWCTYDADTYCDIGSARGPFYEDQNGFILLNGSHKVYDLLIHRAAREGGAPVASSGVPGESEAIRSPAGQPAGLPSPPPN